MRYGCIQLARCTSVLNRNIPFPLKLLRTHLTETERTTAREAAIFVLAHGFFFSYVSYVTETKYIEASN